jgi:hypothetical protein
MPSSANSASRVLWRVKRDDEMIEAEVMPHQAYTGIVIRVDGRPRDAKTFMDIVDALRWAEEQRVNIVQQR